MKLSPAMKNALIGTVGQLHSDPNIYAHPHTIGALEARGLARPRGNAGMFVLTDEGHRIGAELASEAAAATTTTPEPVPAPLPAETTAGRAAQLNLAGDYRRFLTGREDIPATALALAHAHVTLGQPGNMADKTDEQSEFTYDLPFNVYGEPATRNVRATINGDLMVTDTVNGVSRELCSVARYFSEAAARKAIVVLQERVKRTQTHSACRHCGNPATEERVNRNGEWIKLCDSMMCLRKTWADDHIDDTDPRVVTAMILAGDDTGLQAAADKVHAANGETPPPVARQFCRKCLQSCVPAVTLTFDNGARRLHWCADHTSDAEAYRASADVEPVPPLEIPTSDQATVWEADRVPVPPLEIPAVISGPASMDPDRTIHTAYTDALKPGMIVQPTQASPHLPAGPLTVAKTGPRNFGHVDVSFTDGTSVTAAETVLWRIIDTAPTPDVTTVTTADLQPGMIIRSVPFDDQPTRTVARADDALTGGSEWVITFTDGKQLYTDATRWTVVGDTRLMRHIGTFRESCFAHGCAGCVTVWPEEKVNPTVAPAPDPRVDYQTRGRNEGWRTVAVNLTYADAYKIVTERNQGPTRQGGAYRFTDSITGHAVTVHSDMPGELIAHRFIRGTGNSYTLRRINVDPTRGEWWIFRNDIFVHDTATSREAYDWIARIAPGWTQ